MTIAPELLRRIVEGALLAAGQPLTEDRLLSLIDEGERPEKAELKAVLEQIADSGAERGFELKQVASGWRFQVPEDLAPWVNRLWEEKPQKYSRAILETLAIIAYRQPITRGDIEEIRGVAVSSHIVKTLSERGWIKVVGQRDVPGKPSLYATTKEFLDYFNLRTLDDLPTLAEIRDIESLNRALDLGENGGADAGGEAAETSGEQAEGGETDTEESSSAELREESSAEEPEAGSPEEAALVAEIAAEVAAESAGEEAEGAASLPDDSAGEESDETSPGLAGDPEEIAAATIVEGADPETGVDEVPPLEDPAKEEHETTAEPEPDSVADPAPEPAEEPGEPAGLAAELPPSSLFAPAESTADDAGDPPADDAETRDTEQSEKAPS